MQARKLTGSHSDAARELLARVSLLELSPPLLTRALESFPTPLRTLDALHLASMEFLRRQGQRVQLACYTSAYSPRTAPSGSRRSPCQRRRSRPRLRADPEVLPTRRACSGKQALAPL